MAVDTMITNRNEKATTGSPAGGVSFDTLWEPAESLSELSFGLVTNLMHLLWAHRADLQRELPLTSYEGVGRFLEWFLRHGRQTPDSDWGRQPVARLADMSFGLVTNAMLVIWLQRAELRREFPLTNMHSVERFLMWVWVSGRYENELLAGALPARELVKALATISKGLSVSAMASVWLQLSLNTRFNIFCFLLWVQSWGRIRYSILRQGPAVAFKTVAANRSEPVLGISDERTKPRLLATGGANVLGYLTGVFGLAEQGRRVVRALQATDIKIDAVDLTDPAEVRGKDLSLSRDLATEARYAINLIEIPPNELAAAIAWHGDALFRRHYNIGHWNWELPNWPSEWSMPVRAVDEIWATSAFVAGAYSKSTDKLVRVIPPPLTVPDLDWGRYARAHFNLPEGGFIFLFAFDALSALERKNPIASVKAFQLAFPTRSDVCLVIKTMFALANDVQWSSVLAAAEKDKRIRIINAVWPRDEVWGLTYCCDAYISLHRSEGFGLGLMEAMALAKPVVATAFSGNVDFMDAQNSCPVEYSLCAVKEGQYFVWKDQFWAEPNCEHAASLMRKLVEDEAYRSTLGNNARLHVLANYNSTVIGQRYASRIVEIQGLVRSAGSMSCG